MIYRCLCIALLLSVAIFPNPSARGETSRADADNQIVLRAWGVPNYAGGANIQGRAVLAILEGFQKRFPHIRPVSTSGLQIPGKTMDILPLMQIAGDIAPHVMYVNFRQSDTYISSKFLYPLEKYIEKSVGTDIPNGHLLDLDEYLARLKQAPGYERELAERVPRQCWIVMRRTCPYNDECPYLTERGAPPAESHQHVWCYPEGPLVMALFYRRDMFSEAGLPDRVPKDWDELLDYARTLTNPKKNDFGIKMTVTHLSWSTLSFLYSNEGLLVDQDENGQWRCVFNSEAAVEAYYFAARLFQEPFTNKHGEFDSAAYIGHQQAGVELRYGMEFNYLDERFFSQRDPNLYGFGPVPKGPKGLRGSEFNSRMAAIYAGVKDKAYRDAAWEYIRYYDGPEARNIYARMFVENGYGQFVRPGLLRAAGYHEYIRQVPPAWEEAFRIARDAGVPEPYGKNCQLVYDHASKGIDQIRTDKTVKEAIRAGDAERAKARIREILNERVRIANAKMLNIMPPKQLRNRKIVASIVATGILILFALVFRYVFKIFTADIPEGRGKWEFGRYAWAYILLLPAVGTIALWAYYPLARGTVMAFQNYNVRGFSDFLGMENFARVLYDHEFWHAMWVTLKYGLLFILFGFWTPIALAFLLTEVPKGKILFRTIYYLPAVLTGVVVIFLWRGFYGSHGMINQLLNYVIWFGNQCITDPINYTASWVVNEFIVNLNGLPGVALEFAKFNDVNIEWLGSPRFALFFCLLPLIWAGMGPGCLIYLAALKTIPEDLYEAADIDGAGLWGKVFHIAVPGIKGLIMINFIGVVVAQMQGGGGYVLAMTGGGPYNPYGQTELVGLRIFYEAFMYLKFGTATAMAWILGSFLIGFTVLQLQRLKRMEFKTAGTA